MLGGIRDTRTLDSFCVRCGEWTSRDQTITRRWLDPSHVYALADRQALYLYGGSWTTISLALHYSHPR